MNQATDTALFKRIEARFYSNDIDTLSEMELVPRVPPVFDPMKRQADFGSAKEVAL